MPTLGVHVPSAQTCQLLPRKEKPHNENDNDIMEENTFNTVNSIRRMENKQNRRKKERKRALNK